MILVPDVVSEVELQQSVVVDGNAGDDHDHENDHEENPVRPEGGQAVDVVWWRKLNCDSYTRNI